MRIIKCSGPRLPTQGQWDEDSEDRQTFPAWVLAFFHAASPSPGIASGHLRLGRERPFHWDKFAPRVDPWQVFSYGLRQCNGPRETEPASPYPI